MLTLEFNAKGSVGYFCGGEIKSGCICLFFSNDTNLLEKYNEAKEHFGKFVTCKYVNVYNPEKIFVKFKEELKNYGDLDGHMYIVDSIIAIKILKEVAGVDRK